MSKNRQWKSRKVEGAWAHGLVLLFLLLSIPFFPNRESFLPAVGETSPFEPKPSVALTFDDGPSSQFTAQLLDGLKDRGVKATFFVVGENLESPEGKALVKRMADEGHLIGNHTYHHVDLSSLPKEEAEEEIRKTSDLIREASGVETDYIRPPFGALPKEEIFEEELLYVKWTVDPLDWKSSDAGGIVSSVVNQIKEGDIILLHDRYASSVEAAIRIVDLLQGRGFQFVTVDQLLME